MSKKKKKKKKLNAKKAPRKPDKKPFIIGAAVLAAVAAAIVLIAVFSQQESSPEYLDKSLKSVSAYTASGDEADLKEVYNVDRYDNYQGSLVLKDDGTFSFWMTVGDPSDGTHSGTYTYDKDDKKISATFDNGETAEFDVVENKDGELERVVAPYGEYRIWFEEEKVESNGIS